MIIKSYEIQKNKSNILKSNFFLLYGENLGLKNDIREFIKNEIEKKEAIEILSLYESEILDKQKEFYNSVYSGSLFSKTKIIYINDATDKIIKTVEIILEKNIENVFFILHAEILEKKSKLRNIFEINKKAFCIPCYLDTEKDLEIIIQSEIKKNNIILSRESINLLIEKSNSDRHNLRNEIEKIKSYSLNKKKIEIEEMKSLINFSGDYKSEILVNECLCGNISKYKKILSELYTNTINQILLLRILSNKIQRLLKIKEQENKSNNLDILINSTKPAIFWKEKPLVKKQLSIWDLDALKNLIDQTNDTELLCKKNPNLSKIIFFNFFLNICKKANNFS